LVDLTEISAMVAAAGVLVGVVWYILDMRNQTRTRHMELVMRLYATFSSDEFQDAWANIVNRPNESQDYDNFSDLKENQKSGR